MVSETVIRTDVGTTLKIEPKVQYSGRPQFTWTKDGRPLPPNVQVLGYILYVPYVTKENQGVYTLTLVDDYGTAKIQVTIIVDDRVTAAPAPANPGRIIVKQDMDVDLEAGQNANLVCQIQPRVYNPRVSQKGLFFIKIRSNKSILLTIFKINKLNLLYILCFPDISF